MRKIIVFLAALFALTVAAPAAVAATQNVAITKAGFVPAQLTINQGDAITWTNQDTVNRQVISQDAPFSSPVLKPSETYTYTFAKAGKYQITDPLVRKDKMTVTVTAPTTPPPGSGSVSLAVAPRLLTFGGKVTLTGTIANQKVGEQVAVEAQQCGATAFAKVTTLTTTTGGAYSYAVQPLKNTTYRVTYKNASSTTVAVRVRPRITLGKVAPHRFTVRVRAADSFAGKGIAVQRFNTVTKRWVLVRSAILRPSSGVVAPTVQSAVTYTLTVKARTRVRVIMSQASVGSCYAAGLSNAVLA
jgi:plastocyanin